MNGHNVYLSIGSNLGVRKYNISKALSFLLADNKIKILKKSRIYETEPVGPIAQPKFLNQVVFLSTLFSPFQLLGVLKSIEQKLGRNMNGIKWGPRQIDLDILFYDFLILKTPRLIIPHPLISERFFVLKPLAEISPRMLHPVLKKTARQMFLEIRGQEIRGQVST
ncbi:MAG: 2-amino-4-hydroxy-6-hydroxymethyldihydropteridine diphosphokinase [Candidatus Omnitrophota bacterium]|nr:MAG: 2-amino-4-hydroxy-6-hydroxymethyldihydropteridine diphosphokinase [Candidatus Omnitrophota bacterium]